MWRDLFLRKSESQRVSPYDSIEERVASLRNFFDSGSDPNGGATKLQAAIDRICAAALLGDIKECNRVLNGPDLPTNQNRAEIRALVSQHFLFPQQLEWTLHGATRTFRFWSNEEKRVYLDQTMSVARLLSECSESVALGFGAALGYLREYDLIQHDDDTDLIIAIDKSKCPSISLAKKLVFEKLTSAGLKCSGKYFAHWNVFFPDGQHCDVFVGLIEDQHVSFFPSRRNVLKVSDVFPIKEVDFFGVQCWFPADLDAYVCKTYGENWRKPVPYWNHPWKEDEYKDIA